MYPHYNHVAQGDSVAPWYTRGSTSPWAERPLLPEQKRDPQHEQTLRDYIRRIQRNDPATPATAAAPTGASQNQQIGDINSQLRGSGARFNAGKPDLSLIPGVILADIYWVAVVRGTPLSGDTPFTANWHRAQAAMHHIGEFQMAGRVIELENAFAALAGGDTAALIEDTARVFEYGRNKYAAWNWAKGQKWSVPIASAFRHLCAIMNGELIDKESGLPHAGHVGCNIVMLLWFTKEYKEGDDRYVPPTPAPKASV